MNGSRVLPFDQTEDGGAGDMVAEAVGSLERDFHETLVVTLRLRRDRTGEPEGIVGVRGNPEANREVLHHCLRTRPLGEEPHAQPIRGEDVHENVGRSLLVGEVAVVVHR